MLKKEEFNQPDSCLSRAKPDERIFILLARDIAAPATIRFWVEERIRRGKNAIWDSQIQGALDCAKRMEKEREKLNG